ncbi:N-acetyltransferase [Bacteroidales bacterium]|nr:N-acetyltransferase [Bacteroidales bacterium]
MIPFLENEFIKLRALEPEDLDVLYAWENDSELWSSGNTLSPYSKFALREYLSEARQDIYHTKQLRLMIELKDENRAIGTIDLYEFDPMNLRAGVGILLDKEFRKMGLGTQVLDLIQAYAFGFLFLKQLYAYIPQSNEASQNLFLKSSYVCTGKFQEWIRNSKGFEDVLLMQLKSENFIF